MAMKRSEIQRSLIEQLTAQNKTDPYYMDLVEKYMSLWDLMKSLQKDINTKGIRYSSINGNGVETEKPNESIQNLNKTMGTMMNILRDLNLREPSKIRRQSPDEDYL